MKKRLFEVIALCLSLSSITYSAKIDNDIKKQNVSKIFKEYDQDNDELRFNYHQYVKLIASELSVNNDNVLDVYYSFNYLLFNGALTPGDEFVYSEPILEGEFPLGISMLTNTGVCRNIATLFHNVLDEMGYNSKFMVGTMYSKILDEPSLHACVLVRYDNINYLLDPTNEIIYVETNQNSFESIDILDDKIYFVPMFDTNFRELYRDNLDALYLKQCLIKNKNDIKNFMTFSSYQEYENEYLKEYQEYALKRVK